MPATRPQTFEYILFLKKKLFHDIIEGKSKFSTLACVLILDPLRYWFTFLGYKDSSHEKKRQLKLLLLGLVGCSIAKRSNQQEKKAEAAKRENPTPPHV